MGFYKSIQKKIAYLNYWLRCVDEHSLQGAFIFTFYSSLKSIRKKLMRNNQGLISQANLSSKYSGLIYLLLKEKGFLASEKEFNALEWNEFRSFEKTTDSGENLRNTKLLIFPLKSDYYKKFLSIKKDLPEDLTVICLGIHEDFSTGNLWQKIKSYDSVSTSVDLFEIGFLFFDTNYNKNQYILNY